MNYAKCAGLLGALALAVTAPLLAQRAPVKDDLAANAALKYWQAFGQLPVLEEPQFTRLSDWKKTPLDSTLRQLLASSEKSLVYLHRGAKQKNCDWSLDYEDGPGLLLPHLHRARTLAFFACLRARLAFQEGRSQAALDDLLATLTLGRHAAGDPIFICILVDYTIEQNAMDALAPQLPKFDAASLRRLNERLETLPPTATFEQVLATEKEHMRGWAIRWLQDMERAGVKDIRKRVRAFVEGWQDADEIVKLVDDDSAKRLIDALQDMGSYYEEHRRLVALPREQFVAQWPAVMKKESGNRMARLFLPAISKMINARDRYRARLALLKAAIAVIQEGQAALAKHPDPFDQGPFEYKALEQGFELRSKLMVDGEQIRFVVGVPEKP